MEDIAIVGLACRFPGEATSSKNLWEKVLAKGTSTWTEYPPDRFNIDGFHHPDNQRQGSVSFLTAGLSPRSLALMLTRHKLSFRGAHFLKEDLAAFDCSVS